MTNSIDLDPYPALSRAFDMQVSVWPEHKETLVKGLAVRDKTLLELSETVASLVIKIADGHSSGLREVCEDYRYFCKEMILDAELYFRRHGKYKLSKFEDAYREVYSDPKIMKHYMNGLLLSTTFWINHTAALQFYIENFLPKNKKNYSHLEVGPGHGILLYFAARDKNAGTVMGWDISPSSIEATGRTLRTMAVDGKVELECQDVFKAAKSGRTFDSIVASEVLEHLEDPASAIENLYQCMNKDGRILVNMPVNSPAPDHLYLVKNPSEVNTLVESVGFEIENSANFPMVGYTVDSALKDQVTINVSVIGRKSS